MKTHVFQHVPYEGIGNIESWLSGRGSAISYTAFYNDDENPVENEVDFLVIMGGPMSVNDEDEHPWLVKEKQFIRDFIATGKPVLGICLGSQLIASALGARVYPNYEKEIGWYEVEGLKPPGHQVFFFPESFLAFHWHGDTFDLPLGAIQLARSEACENQAFQIGRSVIGLQFHLETTESLLQQMVFHSRNELAPSKFVQPENEILGAKETDYRQLEDLMSKVLEYLADGIQKF
jgi:GMP synthase-like glutamine amidotransferase